MTSLEKMIKFPLLTEENWDSWSMRTKALLEQRRLWEAVDPGYYRDEADGLKVEIPDEELTEAQKGKNMDARNLLITLVEDSFLSDLRQCSRAKDAWESLQASCCDYGSLQIVTLIEELCLIKKGKDSSMRQYVDKIQNWCARLKMVGLDLPDKAVAAFMLRGLGREKYEGVVRAMESNEEALGVKSVRSKLLLEERKMKVEELKSQNEKEIYERVKQEQTEDENVKALLASKKFGKGNYEKGQNSNRIICNTCQEPGHIAKFCQLIHEAKKKGTVLCFNCVEMGHISRNCSKPRKERFQAKGHEVTVNAKEEEQKEVKVNAGCVKTRAYVSTVSMYENDVSKFDPKEMVKARACGSGKLLNVNDGCSPPTLWYLDSGASEHMTNCYEILNDFSTNIVGTVDTANGGVADILGCGSVKMKMSDKNGGVTINLGRVLYVPDLQDNLLSVSQFDNKGARMTVAKGEAVLYDDEGVFLRALGKDGMYETTCEHYVSGNVCSDDGSKRLNVKSCRGNTEFDWHQRFGHAVNIPKRDFLNVGKITDCDVCATGKMKRSKFVLRDSRSDKPLDVVFSDVCGVRVESIGGGKYFVTFTDDFSRFSAVKVMNKKGEVFDEFKKLKAKWETFQGTKLKALQSDNGGEYLSNEFKDFLEAEGVLRRLTRPHTPQQNGVSERLNQQLLTICRCLLIQSNLPLHFWGEALATACFIKNRCISSTIKGIPLELWTGKELSKVEMERMRPFGCKCWVHARTSDKLLPRAVEGIMLGYAEDYRGYRIWNVAEKCVIISRDVEFKEKCFPFVLSDVSNVEKEENKKGNEREECAILFEIEGSSEHRDSSETDDDSENDASDEQNTVVLDAEENDNELGLRRSQRVRKNRENCTCGCVAKVYTCGVRLDPEPEPDPESFSEATNSRDAREWSRAMTEEIAIMREKETWKVVPRPENANVIGRKWVYKKKINGLGEIEKFKARLVAQGFSQVRGVDYFETYSPVMSRKSARLLLAISVELDWKARHLDVLSAYLNSKLEEKVFMEQPKGFEQEGKPASTHVCLLLKSIYGLHQSGKDWNECVSEVLKSLNLSQCKSEPCVFYGKNLIIGLYVDDLLAVGTETMLSIFSASLQSKIEIRDLGFPTTFLAMKIKKNPDGSVSVNQSNYISKAISVFSPGEAKGTNYPLPLNYKDHDGTENKKF